MAHSGFVKAKSDNLPYVGMMMFVDFLREDDRYNASENRGQKATRSASEGYGNKAIGRVEVKREGTKCFVKARVCPEHKVNSKAYSVTVVVDEEEEKICDAQCHDCAASAGGCKHAIAVLMWLHRRTEDPSPTEVECYWAKPLLANTSLKYVKAQDFQRKNPATAKKPDNVDFLEEYLKAARNVDVRTQLSQHNFLTSCQKWETASIYKMALKFSRMGTDVEEFLSFASNSITEELCRGVEIETQKQSFSPLWHEVRFGRITASKIHEAAHCSTPEGSLVNSILGGRCLKPNIFMQRGSGLECDVRKVLQKEIGAKIKPCGLFLIKDFPVHAASPDGIFENFIVEIKCPASEKAMGRYMKEGIINQKCLGQMLLQMHAAKKREGIFCLADPGFEQNKKIHVQIVQFDEEKANDLIQKSLNFWKLPVFPLILQSVNK